MTSFYGSSSANNGKDALNTPDAYFALRCGLMYTCVQEMRAGGNSDVYLCAGDAGSDEMRAGCAPSSPLPSTLRSNSLSARDPDITDDRVDRADLTTRAKFDVSRLCFKISPQGSLNLTPTFLSQRLRASRLREALR
eukprot:1175492-Prorocentrum_minimum.AAC.1